MRETVTVAQAISKGKMKLVYFPMILIFSSIGIGIYLQYLQLFDGWIIAITTILGFLSAWLAWSYFVVDWKIWAFENVRNVHELKRKAIQNNLIWKDHSWFNKTEIISHEQKQKLNYLDKKFLEKDVYHDDISLPKETVITFSKGGIAFGFIFGIAAIAFPVYQYLNDEKSFVYLIFVGLGLFFLYTSIKKINTKEPSIIINSLGIKLAKIEFMSWQSISDEFVDVRRNGKHVNHYLVFKYQNQNQEIQIDELDTTNEKLEKLLQVYRVRFEKNNPIES